MAMYTTDHSRVSPKGLAALGLRVWTGLRNIVRDSRGVSIATLALMMPVLIGFTGLAMDAGVWQINKRNLQGAADQAAFSAAVAASHGASTQQAITQAKAVLAGQGLIDGTAGLTIAVRNPAQSGNFAANTRAWEVAVTKNQSLSFASMILDSAPALGVRAVALQGVTTTIPGASQTQPGAGCILTLDTAAQYATEITNNGSSSNTACEIYTNSNHAKALGCYNNCSILGNTSTVGGYFKQGTMSGTNKTNQTAIANPYGSVAAPTATEMGTVCANSNTVVTAGSAATKTIGPGRYCKGINYGGAGKTLIMTAGTYYIETIFMVGNGATLNATASPGVTIVIVGNYCIGDTNNTCQHPDEGIGNVANINITAPTTGPMAGVAMYFSSTTYRQHNFANTANLHIQGVLYAPNQKLSFNNNSTFDNTKCTKVISLRVTINNNGNMSANCANTGVRTIGDTTTTSAGSSSTTRASMVE
jgi:hypothetical protein